MTTLSMLLRNSINAQLRKTCPETFDPELPDYILLLLTNRKGPVVIYSEHNSIIKRIMIGSINSSCIVTVRSDYVLVYDTTKYNPGKSQRKK